MFLFDESAVILHFYEKKTIKNKKHAFFEKKMYKTKKKHVQIATLQHSTITKL